MDRDTTTTLEVELLIQQSQRICKRDVGVLQVIQTKSRFCWAESFRFLSVDTSSKFLFVGAWLTAALLAVVLGSRVGGTVSLLAGWRSQDPSVGVAVGSWVGAAASRYAHVTRTLPLSGSASWEKAPGLTSRSVGSQPVPVRIN